MQLSYPVFILGSYSMFPASNWGGGFILVIEIIDYVFYSFYIFSSMKQMFYIICVSREKEAGDKIFCQTF